MPEDNLLSVAKQKYPYLQDKDISFESSYDPLDPRMLEFWPPGEPGDAHSPRPASMPIDKAGIQTFKNNVSPLDLLGDYVSHFAVNTDPALQELYRKFQESVPESTMRERYYHHASKLGERRDYETWLKSSGMPEYFRGYTFNQWPNAERMYQPEQIKILNQVRDYLGIKE